MPPVIDLHERRERKAALEHARALVLFECAAVLARRQHPSLLALIDQAFGQGEVERRIRDTAAPRRRASEELRARSEVVNDE